MVAWTPVDNFNDGTAGSSPNANNNKNILTAKSKPWYHELCTNKYAGNASGWRGCESNFSLFAPS